MVLKKLIQEMEKGKKSTEIIRSLISQNLSIIVEKNVNNVGDQDFHYRALDHHLMVALQVNINSLSMLKSCELEGSFIKKRKLDHESDSFDDQYESEERCISNTTRRGCYKRSKTSEPRVEEVSHVTDDGYVWRKYGQKIIQDTNHPRNYYRCTQKQDQKCEATKQVQQISENPTKYKIIYHGIHKCNYNFLKISQFMIDDTQQQNSSAYFLSFDQSNKLNNPKLFPTSAFQGAGFGNNNKTKVLKRCQLSTVSHESYTIQNSCLENINTPQDLTTTTGQSSSNFVLENNCLENSEDTITSENCTSSTASSFDFVEDYSYMFDDLPGVLQDYWWD